MSRAERINALIVKWQIKVGSNRSNSVDQEIIKNLAVTPFCTINNISKKFSVAFTTAQRAINKLEKLGIILQTSTGKRDKIYCATDILKILEEPTRITENLNS
ncbi:hypothetical protein A3306_06670 [Rickettsia bellii]|uniref:DeoR-like helix-turn-helix domain protein n=1 Tax=Rickettsia bellii str. RML An4 TaxID=1359193 RepID=A0A0F3QBD8_RICBE|nr:winged helix-turn-helix transcriptional regulator [Rickettsia bellii]ARD86801.1 hypothetical protein A3306_06670 [Rickettsia bellii]KJV89491.1 deoR-like helix-turn-helix domain protein [Rickettsia bellii str. RML An4]